jgi:hypothetical protein
MLTATFVMAGHPGEPKCTISLPTAGYFHRNKTQARITYSVGTQIKSLVLPIQVHWEQISLTPLQIQTIVAQHEFKLMGYHSGTVTEIKNTENLAA